ncbi:Methylmalonic aciduria and homocystinuria type D, mitochondrial [Araneus ventricosus]|uniref:Methylmalonic aciduria and homocystinuria type D, mitochondrial n=1 Tax=Araneus ventricosus TaxID=182803 RepID=A0A4Y2DZW4_ARAVE|nr:Methylmalonic aciduria and homocystinuria type D, mitochondrial [Araneus ventricosus]
MVSKNMATVSRKEKISNSVGKIEKKISSSECKINFLRKRELHSNQFIYPENGDISVVGNDDIVKKLPKPAMLGGTLQTAIRLSDAKPPSCGTIPFRSVPWEGLRRRCVVPKGLIQKTKIQNLPCPTGDKWEASMPLPEEKYKCILSQYAFNVVDTAMSISNKVECVAHKCPILLRRDFLNLFPSRYLDETLTLVTLCLKTENDMSTWSEEAEEEREKLTQYFITAAKAMTEFLGRRSFWADFVHPTTGKPHSSPLVDDTMFETDWRYRNFGLQIDDLGCCRIISHPIWGTNVFIGAIFTNAPLDCFEVDCIKRRTLYPVLANAKGTPL